MSEKYLGEQMHTLCHKLFPICRSITGDGFRKSLAILQEHMPEMEVFEVPTGTKCFDWVVPKEWNVRDAYVITPDGRKICDFKASNLHLVGYSIPMNTTMTLDELQKHLYSLPNFPEAIPYVTSYYEERWGFCITQNERDQLTPGDYQVYIDSELSDGSLTYGELIIPGESEKEVFLSTYLCHPSMANDQLSGPVVMAFLAQWIASRTSRKYTYRIVIIPETIGSIVYLSKHYQYMRKHVVAGFNLCCLGDERTYSYLPTRLGNTLSDYVAKHVLKHYYPEHAIHSYLDRGSDERQYCSPGIDLPVCSMMRTKYGEYPEYHTSLDDLEFVTPQGLFGGYEMIKRTIECLELDETIRCTVLCEPQLGKRGLYPNISTQETRNKAKHLMDMITYCDGNHTLLEIANKINAPIWELKKHVRDLKDAGLLA